MNLQIEIDSKALTAALAKSPAKVKAGLNIWIKRTAISTEREAKLSLKRSTSRGASGKTLNSIMTFPSYLKTTVKPTTKAAYFVHQGRKAGRMPPAGRGSDLEGWSRRMGLNSFAVARGIAKHGTKGHPFMDEAYAKVKPTADTEAKLILEEIVRSI
jgi:hypothetical protein